MERKKSWIKCKPYYDVRCNKIIYFCKVSDFRNANIIKARFLDFIISKGISIFNSDILIGQELIYGSSQSAVDMLVICNDLLYAFEIKSDSDNFNRLSTQLHNYNMLFDYTYIIVSDKYLKKLSDLKKNNFGIILIDKNFEFKVIRRSKKTLVFDKIEIISTIPSNYLKLELNLNSSLSASEIRKEALNHNKPLLRTLLLQYLKKRLEKSYNRFLSNKGEICHSEDVKILSISQDIL